MRLLQQPVKTRALTLFVVATQVTGNIALSRGMRGIGEVLSLSPLPYLQALLNPWVAGGVLILAFWMLADLALLSRADLSYVLPVTAVAYVLIAIVGHFLLGESISLVRWAGIVVITIGVMLVGGTPARTGPDRGLASGLHGREAGAPLESAPCEAVECEGEA